MSANQTNPVEAHASAPGRDRYLVDVEEWAFAADTALPLDLNGFCESILLDEQYRFRCRETIAEGPLGQHPPRIQEILRSAVSEGACFAIIAIRRAYGDPLPTRDELRAFKELRAAAANIGLRVLDLLTFSPGGLWTRYETLSPVGTELRKVDSRERMGWIRRRVLPFGIEWRAKYFPDGRVEKSVVRWVRHSVDPN